MTAEVKTVSPEVTLQELAEFLVAERVSGAPVTAGGRVLGVVSATDLLEFDSEGRSVPTYRPREDDPLSGEDRWSDSEDENPASYFADLWADAGAEVQTRLATEAPEWSALDDHVVSEIMTRGLVALPPGAEAREAARRMVERGVHRILVMDEDRLAGVVTSTDLVRAVAEHGLAG